MNEVKTNQGELLCPTCQESGLHQEKIITIFRDMEDKDGTKTISQNGDVSVSRVTSSNIPGRRDFATIEFTCEFCPGVKRLHIMQHKGSTQIHWK